MIENIAHIRCKIHIAKIYAVPFFYTKAPIKTSFLAHRFSKNEWATKIPYSCNRKSPALAGIKKITARNAFNCRCTNNSKAV